MLISLLEKVIKLVRMKILDLPEELNIFLTELTQSHLHHLKGNNILKKEAYKEFEYNEGNLESMCQYFNEELGSKLERRHIIKGLKLIISTGEDGLKNVLENDSKLIVYDLLQNVFTLLDELNMDCYLHTFFEVYFQEVREMNPTLTKECFDRIIRDILPYLKLKKALNNMQRSVIPSRSSLVQLLECILYPKISREDCHQIVYNKLQDNNYDLITYKLKPFDGAIGFLGDHFKLEISIKQNDSEKELGFFAKFVPNVSTVIDSMALDTFKKEEFIYKAFIPYLQQLGVTDLSNFAPKCNFTRTNVVLVLEDLTHLGFTSLDNTIIAKYDWIVAAVRKLSRFHACSIIVDQKLKQQSGEERYIGDIFGEYLEEVIFARNGIMDFGTKYIEYFIEKLSHMWKNISVDMFKRQTIMLSGRMLEDINRSDKYYNVISHGDIHGRNILSDAVQNCFLIDFQLIRYCPPAVDLLFLIYMTTEKDFRKTYMEELLKIYYDCLKQNLNLYNIDINQYYTPEHFYESTNYFKSTGVIQAICYLQLNLCPKKFLDEMKNDVEKTKKFCLEDRKEIFDVAWNNETFKTRISSLMEDLYEICT